MSPSSDPQYKNWDDGVRLWAQANNLNDQNESDIPVLKDDVHTQKNTQNVQKIEINPKKEQYNKNDTLIVKPILQNSFNVVQVDYFLNEEYVGSVKTSPFVISIPLSLFVLDTQTITVRLQVYDTIGNKSDYSITLPIN